MKYKYFMEKAFSEIDEKYELEIDRIVKTIKKEKAKRVLLQFPDGMKPWATAIADEIENKLDNENVEIMIWLGSCFGACDVPLQVESIEVDLIVQFGHSEWNYKNKREIKIV